MNCDANVKKLVLPLAIDCHAHLRQDDMLNLVAQYSRAQFGYVVVMGNTVPPILTAEDAINYRPKILAATKNSFTPLMTIMLTKDSTSKTLRDAYKAGIRIVKLIPTGTSVNAASNGITFPELIANFRHLLRTMEKLGMILSIHAELLNRKDGREIPQRCREAAAIPFLRDIIRLFPELTIIIEHASTRRMIEFVEKSPSNVYATLTVHHAIIDYSQVYKDGILIDPFLYCLPVAKKKSDVAAVRKAMISGNPKFLLGSDSAPHPEEDKIEKHKAGIFSAHVVIPLLCKIFEEEGALKKLYGFLTNSLHAYGLKPRGTIVVRRKRHVVPEKIGNVRVFFGGKTLSWQITERNYHQ